MTLQRADIRPAIGRQPMQAEVEEEEENRYGMTTIPARLVKPWRLGPPKKYVFTGGNVVDPVEGVILSGVDVVISGGFVESVAASAAAAVPGAIVVDLQGKYICPGLIDCHLHISSVPGEVSLNGSSGSDPAVSLLRQPFACRQVLDRGFTTVRDTGGATLALKEAIEDEVFPGPRLFTAGRALSQSGGHGDRRGAHDHSKLCCVDVEGLSVVCDGVPECIRAAREQLRTGADFIKIMSGGGVASPTDRLENTQFTADEVKAIAEVARSYGTWVTAHAYTPAAIRHAVDNGVMGIEHGNLIDEDTARYMAERGVWLTPTLVTYDAMNWDRYAGYLPPQSAKKNKEVLARGLQSLKIAAEAGVTMCYGSDLLGPLTNEQSGEFAIRAKVLSNLQVLQSATVNAARMLRQESLLGQVKQGLAADLLILNANPLEDVTILGLPEKHTLAVVKAGRVYTSRWSKLPVDVERKTALIE
ncbi:amidohydrolase [Thozetella sp. PMI_491]|nr:amidohydrolase [Thozetella sp. PMI_491]